MAEGVGFEPTVPELAAQRLSRPPPSTTRPTLYIWWAKQDLNLQPFRYRRNALPIELSALVRNYLMLKYWNDLLKLGVRTELCGYNFLWFCFFLAPAAGLEPAT